jgi:hypothetical protein
VRVQQETCLFSRKFLLRGYHVSREVVLVVGKFSIDKSLDGSELANVF